MSPRARRSAAPMEDGDPGPGTGAEHQAVPHDLEAERSVLGAILLHNDAFDQAFEHLQAGDFFRDAHRMIYAAMQRLLESGTGAADLVTLKHELGQRGQLVKVGGPAYITALVDGLPHSTNIQHYARVVKDKALLRGLIVAGNTLVADAYAAAEDPAVLIAQADRTLLDLQRGALGSRATDLRTSARTLMAAIEDRYAHQGELTGVDTGFQSINDLTFGWNAGDLDIIAARPSIGKTTFVLNTAVAAARSGVRVGFFSFEMRRRQLELRLLSQLSGVKLEKIRNGALGEEHWPRLSTAISAIADLPIIIEDRAGRTVEDIRSTVRLWRADGGLGLVIIDYVQLIPGSTGRRGATRNEEVTDISRRLKLLADDCALPILLVSQMSRPGDGRSDPKPKLTDLRESGALEQDADIVAFLHRKNHRESGPTQFIIEKQRNGPTGAVVLTMDRDTTCFVDGGEEPPDAAPPVAVKKADSVEARTRAIIKRRAGR